MPVACLPYLWSIDWASSKPGADRPLRCLDTQSGFTHARDSPCLQTDFLNLLPPGMGIPNATKRFVFCAIAYLIGVNGGADTLSLCNLLLSPMYTPLHVHRHLPAAFWLEILGKFTIIRKDWSVHPAGGAKVNAGQPHIQDFRMTCSVVRMIVHDRHWFVACFLLSNVEEHVPVGTRGKVSIHALIFSTDYVLDINGWRLVDVWNHSSTKWLLLLWVKPWNLLSVKGKVVTWLKISFTHKWKTHKFEKWNEWMEWTTNKMRCWCDSRNSSTAIDFRSQSRANALAHKIVHIYSVRRLHMITWWPKIEIDLQNIMLLLWSICSMNPRWDRGERITAAVKKEESNEECSRSEREKRVSKFPSM